MVATLATAALAAGLVPRRGLVGGAAALGTVGAVAAASVAWGGLPNAAWTDLDQAVAAAAALVVGAAAAAAGPRGAGGVIAGVGAGVSLLAVELLYRLQAGDAPASWFDGRKIQGQVGYHNALAAFFAIGIPVALWGATRSRVAARVAGGFAVVLLVGCLLLTQSRGAILAAALAVAVQVAAARTLRTATIAALGALAGLALLAPLRDVDASLVASDGGDAQEFRRFATWVLALGLLLALAAALPLTKRLSRALLAVTLAGSLCGAALAFAVVRPTAGDARTWLHQATSGEEPTNLPGGRTRLSSLSLTGRTHLWSVALDAYRANPVLGEGSGGFARTWGVERWTKDLYVLQPHSLELELLGELGVPGALAFLLFLVCTGAALVRAPTPRGARAAAAGVLVALVAEASIDWTFSFPALVVAALLVVGASCGSRRTRPRTLWPGLAAGLAAVAAVALFAGPYLADRELAKARRASATPARAWELARHARRFNPWSDDVLAFQGRVAESTGHFSLAADLYRQAAARALQPWLDEYRRARALRAAGRIRESRGACRLAQAQNPLEPTLTKGPCAMPTSSSR